jgi:catechol 2,3-dioxygenase-like lactoylglutathione lyase family enzyme
MSDAPSTAGRWPGRLPVGSFRVVRPSRNYDRTIGFYRDLVGLPVLETFQASYGEDGTIFGLPGSSTHLEIVRAQEPAGPVSQFDQLVFYLTDVGAQQDVIANLAAHGVQPASEQHPYWEANGGVTYRDPDARGVVFVAWVYGRDVQPVSHPG